MARDNHVSWLSRVTSCPSTSRFTPCFSQATRSHLVAPACGRQCSWSACSAPPWPTGSSSPAPPFSDNARNIEAIQRFHPSVSVSGQHRGARRGSRFQCWTAKDISSASRISVSSFPFGSFVFLWAGVRETEELALGLCGERREIRLNECASPLAKQSHQPLGLHWLGLGAPPLVVLPCWPFHLRQGFAQHAEDSPISSSFDARRLSPRA